jgi:hypothetical protein
MEEVIKFFTRLGLVSTHIMPLDKYKPQIVMSTLSHEYPDTWAKYLDLCEALNNGTADPKSFTKEFTMSLNTKATMARVCPTTNTEDVIYDILYYVFFEIAKLANNNIDYVSPELIYEGIKEASDNIFKYTMRGYANSLIMNYDMFSELMKIEKIRDTYLPMALSDGDLAKAYQIGRIMSCDCFIIDDELATEPGEFYIGYRNTETTVEQGVQLFILEELINNEALYFMESVGAQKNYFYRKIMIDYDEK